MSRSTADGTVVVTLTPTYSGCPATDVIGATSRTACAPPVSRDVGCATVLSPAWTTDWMSEDGPRRSCATTASPRPGRRAPRGGPVGCVRLSVRCPHCGCAGHRELQPVRVHPVQVAVVLPGLREPFDSFKAI